MLIFWVQKYTALRFFNRYYPDNLFCNLVNFCAFSLLQLSCHCDPNIEWCHIRYKELYNTVLTKHLNAIVSKQLNVLVASESSSVTPPTIGHCAPDWKVGWCWRDRCAVLLSIEDLTFLVSHGKNNFSSRLLSKSCCHQSCFDTNYLLHIWLHRCFPKQKLEIVG